MRQNKMKKSPSRETGFWFHYHSSQIVVRYLNKSNNHPHFLAQVGTPLQYCFCSTVLTAELLQKDADENRLFTQHHSEQTPEETISFKNKLQLQLCWSKLYHNRKNITIYHQMENLSLQSYINPGDYFIGTILH